MRRSGFRPDPAELIDQPNRSLNKPLDRTSDGFMSPQGRCRTAARIVVPTRQT
jgi:hypothetical protein